MRQLGGGTPEQVRIIERIEQEAAAPLTSFSAGAAPLDVERLTVILWEAENDDQLGVEYEPRRLAEYILVRLSERTDR